MGLLNKVLGGSTVLLLIVISLLYLKLGTAKSHVTELKEDLAVEQLQKERALDSLKISTANHNNLVRELQSIIAQMHNKNKSLEKENILLRRGVRLDLLTVRVKRNGKAIDSTYQQAYKYLNK
jgi:hypothetical protein